jgi:membrane-associated protease RseP (regulator of RpoE activity)
MLPSTPRAAWRPEFSQHTDPYMLLTIAAFIVALGLLIAVHEYGHYRVAVACGVKVLRFSVGFGKPLLRWQPKGSPTEFVLGTFPLGGYVRMLDEREAPVAAEERHLAFNTQPLRSRAAIVAAGPLANLLLAVLLYSIVNWNGVASPRRCSPVRWPGPSRRVPGCGAANWSRRQRWGRTIWSPCGRLKTCAGCSRAARWRA